MPQITAVKYMTIFQKPLLFFLHFSFILLFFAFSLPSPGIPGIASDEPLLMVAPVEDFGSVPCLNKKLSIIAYLVKDSLGETTITEQEVRDAIDSANKDFAPICLSFTVCNFVYVDNYQYDIYHVMPNADNLDDETEMLDLYYKPRVINMYFVTDVPSDPQCGHAYMPPTPWNPDTVDLVVIKKPCLPTKAISHELGHFFGLYHTFENTGSELVNGSNCTVAGDSLCDTPADPKGAVDGGCNFTGPIFKDNNGDWYFPPVDNIMSYYDDCPCRFSREQYFRMAQQYLTYRSYLW